MKYLRTFGNFFAICSVIVLSSNAYAKGKSRPMSEMHGTCSEFKMNLKKELKAWQEPITQVKNGDSMHLEKKLDLSLVPSTQVQFLAPPAKKFPMKTQSHGGLFKFKVPEDGVYRVAAGTRVWFDVVDVNAKTLVDEVEFEMQSKCDKIFKVVTFNLKQNAEYALQVDSSANDSTLFLVSKE
jgi:hypothetical protein